MEKPYEEKFKYARLIGFDFIRDKNGNWWLLEVNDTPSYLSGADELSSNSENKTLRSSGKGAIDSIASVLANSKEEGTAIILQPLIANAFCENEDHLDSLNISIKTAELGRNCRIIYPDGLDPDDGTRLRDGSIVAAIYRRTHARADCCPLYSTINPAVAATVCRDKLISSKILSTSTLMNVVPTSVHPPSSKSKYLSKYWIRKPRFGSASRGVSRESRGDQSPSTTDNDIVWQPWIEPDTVDIHGKSYYYDIRVLSFDGNVVAAYARCAAAPVGGVAKNMPLEWLTTTGRRIPIHVGKKDKSTISITIRDDEALLIKNTVQSLSNKVESAIASRTHEMHSQTDSTYSDKKINSILYVFSPSNDYDANASLEALRAIQSLAIKPIVYNIDALSEEWEEVQAISGWELMPQLYIGTEYFVGSSVICEAVRSGEIERAQGLVSLGHWRSDLLEEKFHNALIQHHEAEVWALSSTDDGESTASGAADGTICLSHAKNSTFYKVDDCWINAISLSPCGRHLAVGTSKAEVFSLSLSGSIVKHSRKLIGHSRWVNGVVALDADRLISASSDGTLALWANGTLKASSIRKSLGGHILGMKYNNNRNSVAVWSSDGLVTIINADSLSIVSEWKAPSKLYVTAACEGLIHGEWGMYAIDIKGVVYSSHYDQPIFCVNERAWGMTANFQAEEIVITTISGKLIVWSTKTNAYETREILSGSPTCCLYIPNTKLLMVGFSNGEVKLCQNFHS